MDQREAMEAEMNALIETLSSPGGPGLSGNLTDSEGFPLSDIDVSTVRAQRKRLAELRNDHKKITDRIQKNIELLHSAKLPQNADTKNQGMCTSASSENHPMEVDPVVRIPFAMIDEIAEDSPAAEDGLQLGDEIVKFGNVEIGERLQERLMSEAQSNQGCPFSVVVIRRDAISFFYDSVVALLLV
ncbi:26S proteasome non-ATPase regulatory subunit 9-like protein [Carex littledalei]|uniref:26S proteasome non-ATPase regulatory subunit 9-like protein n=1 Tax=Carex littledalei TaxID=544730 RepID=A0A833VGJ0_9POAL|nr:26S proteasome non-ATPase regulatory subunit 9-like protein [Carex littledalei]